METIGGRRVLHVMAAEAEYGAALGCRIEPVFTGVGPVEAAAGVAEQLGRLVAAGTPADAVVSLGSAGSATRHRASVHQVASVTWRDIDASVLGVPAGETPFLGLAAEQPIPWQVPGLAAARLSTGADVVSGARYTELDADLVDMETWAVLRACQRGDVPLIGLRGVSDGDDELAGMTDWSDHLADVDAALADALDVVHVAIGDGLLERYVWDPPTV